MIEHGHNFIGHGEDAVCLYCGVDSSSREARMVCPDTPCAACGSERIRHVNRDGRERACPRGDGTFTLARTCG